MARIGKEQLIKLQKKYKTDEAIARLYGLTRQAIAQQRKRYGIGVAESKNDERNRRICELWEKGIPVSGIASKFRLSTTHIYRVLNSRESWMGDLEKSWAITQVILEDILKDIDKEFNISSCITWVIAQL